MAGGNGSRLYPLTLGVSKHLLAIYDKPMIYYPLSLLMLSGIKDVLIITNQDDLAGFQRVCEDGSKFGINISYAIQNRPNGIAEAFSIGESFIGNDKVCLVLGDNIFYGQGFTTLLRDVVSSQNAATIFGYQVKNPELFGVVEFDESMRVLSLDEKPLKPKSNYAVTGLYFYDNDVIEIAKSVKPSLRGELEITSINQIYHNEKKLRLELLGRGFAWLDTGTFESLLEAAQFVETIEKRQGYKIACLEEIAWRNGWLSDNDMVVKADKLSNNSYGEYLHNLVSRRLQ